MSLDNARAAILQAREAADEAIDRLRVEGDALLADRDALDTALAALDGVTPPAPTPPANPGPRLTPTRDRIIAAFDDPDRKWTPKGLAHHLDVPVASVSQHLTRLVKDGLVDRYAAGQYRSPVGDSPPLVLGPNDVRDPGRGSHDADGRVPAVQLDSLGPLRTVPFTHENARAAAT